MDRAGWRVEADDEWLAAHRGTFFRRRRSRVLGAIADAELGPLRGAPRRPRLKLPDQGYSHQRYAPRHYAYTAIQIDLLACRRCGRTRLERHRLVAFSQSGALRLAGSVQRCGHCDWDSWLFLSHMPRAEAGRQRDGKVVV